MIFVPLRFYNGRVQVSLCIGRLLRVW